MKKLLTILVILSSFTSSAFAQAEDFNSSAIWGRGRYMRLGYVFAQTGDDFSPVSKEQYAFFIQKGTSFNLHKKPVGNMVKFRLDVNWFDFQFSKYKNPYEKMPWTSEIEQSSSSLIPDIDDDMIPGMGFIKDIDFNNLGTMSISASVGVGPSVSVAPFVMTNQKRLHPLRVSAYFHYSPTMMMYMKSQEGDIELSNAFVNTLSWGLNINYRVISLGMECRWGNANFKPLDFGAILGEDSGGVEKYNRKFANTRLYIQFAI